MKRMTMKFMALALLVLASTAALHAQVAFQTTTVQRPMRQEGLAEAAGDITLVPLTNGTIIAGSSIDFTFSVAIATPSASITTANISCVATNCGNIAIALNGTNTVRLSFTGAGTTFAAGGTNRLTLRGLRLNANAAVGVGTVSVSMSGTSPDTTNNPLTFTTSSGLVGILNATMNATFTAASLLQSCAIANANSNGLGTSTTGFSSGKITVQEAFGDALLTAAQENALAGNPASTVGVNVTVTLNGVPAGIRVIPPAASVNSTVVTPGVGQTLVLTLSASSPTLVDQTVSGTPVVFVYTVTASTQGVVEAVDLSFLFGTNNAASTSSTTSIPTIGGTGSPVTAGVSVTPIDTVSVPRFAANQIGPTLIQNITDCTTRLLFTWVATVADVETGVAIANTSSDDAAFGSGTSNGATSQSGTCTLTGYPSAGGTPVSFTTASIPAGQTLAFVMSGTTGFSNFTGYVLTVCNFQAAHAFAFITNGRGTVAGPTLAQGYLANVIPTGRRPGTGITFSNSTTAGATVTLSTTTETLGD